jgi:hypothetical protein
MQGPIWTDVTGGTVMSLAIILLWTTKRITHPRKTSPRILEGHILEKINPKRKILDGTILRKNKTKMHISLECTYPVKYPRKTL